MLLKEFLRDRINVPCMQQAVYNFIGKNSNPTLIAYLLQGLKKKHDIINFSFEEKEWKDFESTAYTTFLGNVSLVWLGNCSQYDKNLQKKINLFLNNYKGPHTIIAVWQEKEYEGNNDTVIKYEEHFDFETVQLFYEYALDKKIALEYKGIAYYTPEQIFIFYLYTLVFNEPHLLIKHKWDQKLFMYEGSLFELSKLFFAKKKDGFFTLLKDLERSYAPVFWTVFWSEQLWNAFLVVYFRKKKEFNTAKQFHGRLPFSFLQYDWQNYSIEELYNAHNFITHLDRTLKLSASPDALELFYYTFFSKK